MPFIKHLYKSLLVITLALISIQCDIDHSTTIDDASYQEALSSESQVIETGDLNKLSLQSLNGQIKITGNPKLTQLQINTEKITRAHSREAANAALSNISVLINQNDNTLNIKSEHPANDDGTQYLVNYCIDIPNTWHVTIDQFNGTVELDSLFNETELDLGNGLASLDDLRGSLHVTLLNGDIETTIQLFENSTCKQNILNGQLLLNIPKSTSAGFDAYVANGTIEIKGLELDSMATSPHYVRGVLNQGKGTIDLNVANGAIRVTGY